MPQFNFDFQFPEPREFVRDSFEVVNGFSRPNWKAISAYIATSFADDRIQEFGAGTSFSIAGKSCEFSYRLSELLLNSVMRDLPAFCEFLKMADVRDAGQDAALQCLGASLGDIAGEFLGEGNWRPNRKKIGELWRFSAP